MIIIFVFAIFAIQSVRAQTSVVLDSTKYWLKPDHITITTTVDDTDQEFHVTIMQEPYGLFGFTIMGCATGMPTHAVQSDVGSGGTFGSFMFKVHMYNHYFKLNGNEPETFTGYIPISISHEATTGSNIRKLILLPITVIVKPKK